MNSGSDWARELWPDEEPDPDWPESDSRDRPDQPPGGVVSPWSALAAPAGAPRGRKVLALALTAVVALGAGAGAAYLYKNTVSGSAPGAAAPSPSAQSGGTVTTVLLLGQVLHVGRDSVTVGGGPGPAISARVTSATRFTGSVRSLAQVRAGDTVAVQITESGSVAQVVSLQDPASQP